MHIKSPAGTTTITVSVCPRCGTIMKSDKSSCCGRGGSWFGKCGSPVNPNLGHTWSEGIRACKTRAQSKTVIDKQLNAAQQKGTNSFINGADTTNSKVIVTAAEIFLFTSTKNNATPIITSVSTSLIVRGCQKILNIYTHISLFLVITL